MEKKMKNTNTENRNQTTEAVEISIQDKKNELAMDMFKQAIKLKKETAFVNPETATDEEALGILISQFAKWDGKKIFDASYNAFEDSNFHSFNEGFEKLWTKEVVYKNYVKLIKGGN
jgi:hypothetical protein